MVHLCLSAVAPSPPAPLPQGARGGRQKRGKGGLGAGNGKRDIDGI
jgi:hypothetical protein